MTARSIWRGSISFGLVNIPVKVFAATEDSLVSFNQLCKNGHRIQYKRWCPVEQREVSYEEIKKGYQISKDNYVLIEKQELENIKVKTTKIIEIDEFVSADALDPIFVEKSYYIAPDSKTVDKAYLLFVNILKNTDRVALGKVILRDREQMVALRAYQRGILMHVLHYLDEIRPMDEIKEISQITAAKVKLQEQEIALGNTLVEQLTSKDIDLSKYSDTYTKKVEELIEAKSKGRQLVQAPKLISPESTTDLLAALKASLNTNNKGPRKKA